MKSLFSNSYHDTLFCDHQPSAEHIGSLTTQQPFLNHPQSASADRLLTGLTRQNQRWQDLCTLEQTAYALSQVTAARILPPLRELEDGNALLDYCVHLRDYLEGELVEELTVVLNLRCADFHWQQIQRTVYGCVIYSGVAVCIDTTRGEETLYLRYANQRAEAIGNARFNTEIPLSLIGLQKSLFERFDALLTDVRLRTLFWLST